MSKCSGLANHVQTISYAQPVCSAFDIKTDVILDERKLKKDQTNLIMLGS